MSQDAKGIVNGMPQQTVGYSRKTKSWAIKCVNSVENVSGLKGSSVRKSRYNKVVNYNLWDGILMKDDIEQLTNPDQFDDNTLNTNIQHNPIIIGKFNVLIGEEARRRFEPQIIVTNPTAVSAKESEMSALTKKKITDLLQNEELTDDQKKQLVEKHKKFLKYEYQDQREVRANRMLKYLTQELRLKKKFNDGFKNALICAEEIYEIDEFGGSLEFNVLNPKNVHTIMTGESNRIEDADIIVIESYRSPGQLLDRYHQELTPKEVKKIENMTTMMDPGGPDFIDSTQNVTFYTSDTRGDNMMDNLIDLAGLDNDSLFGHYLDSSGNVRELRVLWASKRKLWKITYPNPDTGEMEEMVMPETYKPDIDKGETAKAMYVREWWEGTKLAKDIYLRLQPKKTQYFRMENPSLVHPGIVGTIYNTNNGKGVSMMDRAKPYQYMYDVIWDRLREALATYTGPILEMDMAKVPDGWSFEKWLFYMRKMKIAATDSFKVGNKGPAKGKLAGNFNTTGKVLNLDMGNYIQQMIMLLQFTETQLAVVTGVTKQREGQIENRETVGGVERAVQQSNSITEGLYFEHEETMIRATKYLIEAAKNHYRGKKFKAQYFLDDGSLQLFDVDGDEYADADYDVVTVSGAEVAAIRQQLQQLAHAGMQNDTINFSTVMDIMMSPSMQDMRRSIEIAEGEKMERDQQRFQQEQETQKHIADTALQDKQQEREQEMKIAVLKSDTEIEKALIQAETLGEEDNTGDIAELELKRDNLLSDIRQMESTMNKDKERKKQLELENEQQKTKNRKEKPSTTAS